MCVLERFSNGHLGWRPEMNPAVLRAALLQASPATTSSSTSSVASSGNSILFTVAEVAVALAVIAVLGVLFTRITRRIALRAGASRAVAHAVDELIAVVMLMIAVAAVASLTGLSSEFTTLTISGIGGLAASLALQTTFSNIIAGILMLQDGVLRLGDDIEFGSARGEVVKLSLRTTWLKRQDGVIVLIGNSNLAAGPIVNHSAKDRLERKLEE